MTGDERGVPTDPLGLAEAVSAGALTEAAAEAILRAAHGADTRRADEEIAELRDLLTAIRGVRRHAEAFHATADSAAEDAGSDVEPVSSGPLSVVPRRVARADVRLRPAHPVDRSRWATSGVLAAAAVVVLAVVVVGSQLTTSRIAATPSPSSPLAVATGTPAPSSGPSSQLPSPSSGAPSPTATGTPAPGGIGVPGVPPIVSEALGGTPGIVYWTLTAEDRISVTEWNPNGDSPAISFTASTWPDPARADGTTIDRRVVVSPDGRHIAFEEREVRVPGRWRLRVFDASGALEWTDPNPADDDFVWSADGARLALGHPPGMWRIVTFGSGKPSVATLDLGGAYALLGFSESGDLLYGYQTEGEQEFWSTPISYPRSGGSVTTIGSFSGQADPLAVSNGTTPTTAVAQDAGTLLQPGVDPQTGHVLDTGGLSGLLQGWELRDGTTHTPLDFGALGSGGLLGLGWGPDGSIVVAAQAAVDSPLDLRLVLPAEPSVVQPRPTFTLPSGTYWQRFDGVRGTTVLLGLAADRAHDSLYLGADELVAVDLSASRGDTLMAAVLIPTDAGLTGIHVAGWVTAP